MIVMGAAARVKKADDGKKQEGEATAPGALRRMTKQIVDKTAASLKKLVRSMTTAGEPKDEWVFEDEEDGFTAEDKERLERRSDLATGYKRLIAYAASGTVAQQRKVAEMLANAAVQPVRRREIVELGGLNLLLPLTKSKDNEVQRLSAHALANISVDSTNQVLLAEKGGIEMLVTLLENSKLILVKKQSAKALANISVNVDNKIKVTRLGGLAALMKALEVKNETVRTEIIAALANLAVNDENESLIGSSGGLKSIIEIGAKTKNPELLAQVSRALINLSVNPVNQKIIRETSGLKLLEVLSKCKIPPIKAQASKALENIQKAAAMAQGDEGKQEEGGGDRTAIL